MKIGLILALAALPLIATADVLQPGEKPGDRRRKPSYVPPTQTTATTGTTATAQPAKPPVKPPVEAAATAAPDRYTFPLVSISILGMVAITLLFVRRKRAR